MLGCVSGVLQYFQDYNTMMCAKILLLGSAPPKSLVACASLNPIFSISSGEMIEVTPWVLIVAFSFLLLHHGCHCNGFVSLKSRCYVSLLHEMTSNLCCANSRMARPAPCVVNFCRTVGGRSMENNHPVMSTES